MVLTHRLPRLRADSIHPNENQVSVLAAKLMTEVAERTADPRSHNAGLGRELNDQAL